MRHKPEWRDGCVLHYHDTQHAYNRGCRCPTAREAHRLYLKRKREGRHVPREYPAIGIQRRIRALCAFGWSIAEQSRRMGITDARALSHIAHRKRHVYAATHHRVVALYEQLQMTPGPSDHARRWAAAHGWAPPFCWDAETIDDPAAKPAGVLTRPEQVPHDRLDPVVVERAVAGTRPVSSSAEKAAAVALLTDRRWSSADIADRLGITQRTVERFRASNRESIEGAA